MNKIHLALLFLLSLNVTAQNLPDEWEMLTDDHLLKIGRTANEGLYNVNEIKSVYLTFADPNWQNTLASYYNTNNYLSATLTIDGLELPQVGVQYKGQTSYTMLPQGSQKKSFSIKTDQFIANQEIQGYNNLNLNNCFQDATFLKEFIYVQLIRKHIPAAKASFTKLYINGESWGLYVNVQQMNKDYLEEWFLSNDGTNWRADSPIPTGGGGGGPQWGDGTAALNYLGTNQSTYQQYYTLKSTEETDPWSLLVNTCDVLNNTPIAGLTDQLPAVMDVDRALWFLACEIAFGDDDSYVYKGKMDYYVYWEKETGRTIPLEFDGNSVLTTQTQNWSPFYHADNVNFPLMNRLMQVPEYRQRYLAHMRTIVSEMLSLSTSQAMISQYSAMIDAEVQADTKKIYTYQQFLSGLVTLQNIINTRRNTINNNAEVNTTGAVITNLQVTGSTGMWQVLPGENPIATVDVISPDGIAQAWLYYSDAMVGNFSRVPLLNAGGSTYEAILPAIELSGIMRVYVEAVEANAAGTRSYLPVGAEHDVFYYFAMPEWVDSEIVINEIMAKNNTTALDEAGQYEDWIEIFNKGSESVDVSGYYLSDDISNLTKWVIPNGVVIAPGDYLIVWCDEDEMDGFMHSNFKLSSSGENLTLLTNDLKIADQVFFETQQTDMGYARVPNGTGDFTIQEPTFSANNNTLGVAEDLYNSQLLLYPNPAKEQFQVLLPEITLETGNYTILDLNGRTMKIQQIAAGTRTFSVNTQLLSNGIYLIKIELNNEIINKRFVVAK
jgi:hypothetical protein